MNESKQSVTKRAPWNRIEPLPREAAAWKDERYDELIEEMHSLLDEVTDKNKDKTLVDIWLRERTREFAIETGQIEGLYTLKKGITEQLITEGLHNVVASHTLENIDDETIKGLLEDQEDVVNTLFGDMKKVRPLTQYVIKSWHGQLTRHQTHVAGLRPKPHGGMKRVQVEFKNKGMYKIHPNNPRRPDGVIHEYCPPEHVQSEMDKLLEHYEEIRNQSVPTHVEAAWLHHRFVQIHPFQDGNGRVARMLMAYCYTRRGEPCPVIRTAEREAYIGRLETADQGNLRPFAELLCNMARIQAGTIINTTQKVLDGNETLTHRNGGVTNNGKYYPPDPHDIEV